MAKILLVEDDSNLREIYEARLMAEGYEIVSARDGEEALTIAIKEKPDLIISDVMMPKISGFDMLDILRNTDETKNTKVIMMTALSQAEDKARAKKLGANRYLVKSQVTLEDVARVAQEVLDNVPAPEEPTGAADSFSEVNEISSPSASNSAATAVANAAAATDNLASVKEEEPLEKIKPTNETQTTSPTASPTPIPEPISLKPSPSTDPDPVSDDPTKPIVNDDSDETNADLANLNPVEQSLKEEESNLTSQPNNISMTETVEETKTTAELGTNDKTPETVTAEPETKPAQEVNVPEKTDKKIISPINDLTADNSEHLNSLAEKEAEKEAAATKAKEEPLQVVKPTQKPADYSKTPIEPPMPETKIDPDSIAL
jgi:DNA-binding response OmpR family regulator